MDEYQKSLSFRIKINSAGSGMERSDKLIPNLDELLDQTSRKFARSRVYRRALGKEAKDLQKEIRKRARNLKTYGPNSGYLSRNVFAKAGYSNTRPYSRLEIYATGKAKLYWIQREGDPDVFYGNTEYRDTIYSSSNDSLVYIPASDAPPTLKMMTKGYDKRPGVNSVRNIITRAGYHETFIRKIENPIKVKTVILGWKTSAQRRYSKRKKSLYKPRALFLGLYYVKGGPATSGGNYIGPSVKSREEEILKNVIEAWGEFVKSQGKKKGSRRG